MTEQTSMHALERPRFELTAHASRSGLRAHTKVGELVTAFRCLLRDDRESARAFLERVAEMMADAGGARIVSSRDRDSESSASQGKTRGGLAPWQIRQVTAHVETHLDQRITTRELAAIANLSTCHFARVFHQSLSVKPREYVLRRRLQRAQELMLTTSASLGQIATDCGFADQPHFNKVFRRLMADSPRAWRRARLP